MKHVADVRKRISGPTIFNRLGPAVVTLPQPIGKSWEWARKSFNPSWPMRIAATWYRPFDRGARARRSG